MNELYHSDEPISLAKEDLFGRMRFAQNIVKIVKSFNLDENFVIGLYAKWGMGKTSTVNLIQSALDSSESLEGIYVNAWTLGGETEKIFWDILNQISTQLTGTSAQSRINKIGKRIDKIASAGLPFDMDANFDFIGAGRDETKVSLGKIADSVGYIGRLMASSDGIKRAKEKVEKTIKEKDLKIVVFIDDIDRLNKNQIADIFRLINNIANYEGITFVLPFDKEYVSAALEDQLPKGQRGNDYLEKIVQIPLHLPAIPRYTLDDVFTKKLQYMLAINNITIDQQEMDRFRSLYFSSGLNVYVSSPRAINKIMNVLHSLLLINHGKQTTLDSITIEIIRVFDEKFYRAIYSSRELLLEHRGYGSYSDSDEKVAKRKREITELFSGERGRRLAILKDLFPQVQYVMHNHGDEDPDDLRQAQRIASKNYFDIFFSHFDESYGVSDKKLLTLLSNVTDKDSIDEGLVIINENNFSAAMQTIGDHHDKIANKLEFAKSLLDVAARLPNATRSSAFSLNPLDKALFIIDDILKTSTSKVADYTSLLHYTFDQGRVTALPYAIRQVVLYSTEERSREEPLLNEDELAEYKKTALDVIRNVAKANKMPIDTTDSHYFLYSYWADFCEKSEIETYLKKHIKSADGAIDFVSQFLGKWSSLTSNSGYHRSDLNEATFKDIGRYIDQQYLYDLITKDKKYAKYKNITSDSLEYLDSHGARRDKDMNELSRVGNEHTDEFRLVIAKQFIYQYENTQNDSGSVAETETSSV